MSAFIIRVEKKRMNVFDSIKKNRPIVGSIFEIFHRCFVFVEAILNNILYFLMIGMYSCLVYVFEFLIGTKLCEN